MPRSKPEKPTTPKSKKPGERHRCTKLEREYRIRKLLQLYKNGYSTDQLEDYTMSEFGLKREMARKYVNEVLQLCVEAMSTLDKQRIAAITLLRFENAYRVAASQRNAAAMVAANAQIALHWVHHAPEITVNDTSSTDKPDPEEDF